MAANETRNPAQRLSVVPSAPATPVSGDPVRYGAMTGLAQTSARTDGTVSVDFGMFSATFSVKGVDGSGNSAVAVGDSLFYVDGDSPPLSKKASGTFFGIALAAVTSGSTKAIDVLHLPTPAGGTLTAGGIGTTQLAAAAVTAAKLTATLGTGFLPLPLAQARLIATNDIAAIAASGGVLGLDTAPKLKRVNGATDKKLRIEWAAASVIPITWDVVYPPDLDDTAVATIKLLAAMAGATDTPTVAVNFFENVGDTNAGGNTGAVTGTTPTVYSRTIAAVDVGPVPAAASIELVPAAHGTDALYLYAAWVEYTRK